MNPKAQRTILKQSRIFGYASALLSIPFALLGGLIASCCPLGVLVGALPLLITSMIGAQLAAIFLDYSVVSKRNATGAGLRVGVRSAAIGALAGGIVTLFTASQSLSAMTAAAAGAGTAEGGGVGAAITIGLMNLLMLLLVVAFCALIAILPGVIGAALRGSAAQDSEPEPEPGWEAELKTLKKSSMIEWVILLGLLAAAALVIPVIQQYSMGKSQPRQQQMTSTPPMTHAPAMQRPNVPQVAQPPPSSSPDGKYTVEILEDSQQGRLIVVKERGKRFIEVPTIGYLLSAHWSPAGSFLAVNERRANSGDYLWILDLQGQRILKRPDNAIWLEMESKSLPILKDRANKKWGDGVEHNRDWGTAARWENENTLVANVTVRFQGSMIAVGEESRLEVDVKLSVNHEGVSLLAEPPTVSRRMGQGLLFSGFDIEFIEESATLISTFEWYARFGAERVTMKLDDLDLESAKVEPRNERGAFEGGVPVMVPFKSGISVKKERWGAGGAGFSWSLPPDQIIDTKDGLTTTALDQEKATALVSALRALRASGDKSLASPNANSPKGESSPSSGKVLPLIQGSPTSSPELLSLQKDLNVIWSGSALPPKSLEGLSPWELKVLRNAIFARHGRAFESGKLSGFFHRYSGYKENAGYSDNHITLTDRANAEAIKAAEPLARRPAADTAWNALRNFLDALAAGDVDSVASLIHSTKPLERVTLTLDEPPKVSEQERFFGNSKRLKNLCLDDGANGEGYSFMMSTLWNFTLAAQNAGNGMFRNNGSSMEIGFTEISGKWWLTRVADTAP